MNADHIGIARYSVRTEHTSEGITETSTWHLGIVGKELNWFPSACSD